MNLSIPGAGIPPVLGGVPGMVSELLLVCALCGEPADLATGLRQAAPEAPAAIPAAERPPAAPSLWGPALLQLGLATAEGAGSVAAGLPSHRLAIDIPAALGAVVATGGVVLGVAWLLRDRSGERRSSAWGKIGGFLALGAIAVAPPAGVLAAEALAGNPVSAGGLLAGTAISLVAWLLAWATVAHGQALWQLAEGGSTLPIWVFAGTSLLAVGAGATLGHALVDAP